MSPRRRKAEIVITTLLSNRTKLGGEITVEGGKAQLDIAKAREVCAMFHEAAYGRAA